MADSLEQRVERLEADNARLQQLLDLALGNLTTPGNLTQQADRPPTSPLKHIMTTADGRGGLYTFMQERFPDQGSELWAGVETFVKHQTPAWGYGALPLRLWGQNCLLEANGVLVVREVVTEKVTERPVKYCNLTTGKFEEAASYDEHGVPLDSRGNPMGGIHW